MSRLTVSLIALVALLSGALITSLVTRPAAGLSEDEVRTIIGEMAVSDDSVNLNAGVDAASIHPMIESYLLANPRILERVSLALDAEIRAEENERARVAIAELSDKIYNDPGQIVLGNPDGDVTLVEMFDYNCGFCRQAVPELATLLAEDPNLRVIMKEFPILSQDSVDAARIGIAAHRAGVDYWDFHSTLFSGRGRVTKATALAAAEEQGLNPIELELDAESDDVSRVLQNTYEIAQGIGASGTPAYIIGDELIPGAVGAEALKERIANMRACGKTVCDG